MSSIPMHLRNIIAAVVLLAVGIAYAVLTFQLPERSMPNTPGPYFFPLVIAAIFLVLAFSLLIQGAMKLRKAPLQLDGFSVPVKPTFMLVWFVAFVVALPYVGFLVAAPPFFAGMAALYGAQNKVLLMVASLVIPVVLFFLFRDGFQVLLPRSEWLGF